MGYNSKNLKIVFSYTHAYIWVYTYGILSILDSIFFTVQQYGSEWIAVLSLKGMRNKNIYILENKKAVVSFGPVSFTDRTASASSYHK